MTFGILEILFLFFASFAVVSAVAMITRESPVASAVWLIGTFFALAAIYTLLGAFFIGVIQILVYAGAIMVLFLFVIMLLNLGNDYEPDIRSNVWKMLAAGSSLVLLALFARMFGGSMAPLGAEAGPAVFAAQLAERGVINSVGIPLYQDYIVPLQVTAILLLIAVVGAVALAKRNI